MLKKTSQKVKTNEILKGCVRYLSYNFALVLQL